MAFPRQRIALTLPPSLHTKNREDTKKTIRLYKVKLCELCDINAMEPEPPSSTFILVFSVINYKHPQAWDYSYIDPDKQLYYFETNAFHYGTSKVNQQFLIPGSTNEVSWVSS